MIHYLKKFYWALRKNRLTGLYFQLFWDPIKTHYNLLHYRKKDSRKLEIGTSGRRIAGFESLSIAGGPHIDYVWDASGRLPFAEGTFEIVYASHVLEHIPWYQTEQVLREWIRILKSGGTLEIHVPDYLKLAKAFIDAEEGRNDFTQIDAWCKFNDEKDPCKWASGRFLAYGDGAGAICHPNWHRAMFTPRYLRKLFDEVGLVDLEKLDSSEMRSENHGWVNLGYRGTKRSIS